VEATGLNSRGASAIDFALRRFIIKVFKGTNNDVIEAVYEFMDIEKPSSSARVREGRFLSKFDVFNSSFCFSMRSLFPVAYYCESVVVADTLLFLILSVIICSYLSNCYFCYLSCIADSIVE
jgi:hypothetical protein